MKLSDEEIEAYAHADDRGPNTPIVEMARELILARKIMKEVWFCNLVKPFRRLKALLEEYDKL